MKELLLFPSRRRERDDDDDGGSKLNNKCSEHGGRAMEQRQEIVKKRVFKAGTNGRSKDLKAATFIIGTETY